MFVPFTSFQNGFCSCGLSVSECIFARGNYLTICRLLLHKSLDHALCSLCSVRSLCTQYIDLHHYIPVQFSVATTTQLPHNWLGLAPIKRRAPVKKTTKKPYLLNKNLDMRNARLLESDHVFLFLFFYLKRYFQLHMIFSET